MHIQKTWVGEINHAHLIQDINQFSPARAHDIFGIWCVLHVIICKSIWGGSSSEELFVQKAQVGEINHSLSIRDIILFSPAWHTIHLACDAHICILLSASPFGFTLQWLTNVSISQENLGAIVKVQKASCYLGYDHAVWDRPDYSAGWLWVSNSFIRSPNVVAILLVLIAQIAPLRCALSERATNSIPRRNNASSTIEGKRGSHDTMYFSPTAAPCIPNHN